MTLIIAISTVFLSAFLILNFNFYDIQGNLRKANQIRPNTMIMNQVENNNFDVYYDDASNKTGGVLEFTSGAHVFMPVIINETNIQNAIYEFNQLDNIDYKNFRLRDLSGDGQKSSYLKVGEGKRIYLGQKFLYCNEAKNVCDIENNKDNFILY